MVATPSHMARRAPSRRPAPRTSTGRISRPAEGKTDESMNAVSTSIHEASSASEQPSTSFLRAAISHAIAHTSVRAALRPVSATTAPVSRISSNVIRAYPNTAIAVPPRTHRLYAAGARLRALDKE